MERSGHRERKEMPLRVVVKMCFYAILLDIFFILFCFLFRIINVLLAGMSRICNRFRYLHECIEIDEVAPEDSPVVEDFADDSASLRDAHHVTDTNPPKMNDIASSSESNGADHIPEDPEDAATEDIGLEKSPVVEDDLKNSANLIDAQVTDTSSPKMSNDTTSSPSSESNGVDDIRQKDSENMETKVIDLKISYSKGRFEGGFCQFERWPCDRYQSSRNER